MKNVAYYNGHISSIEEMTIPLCDRAVYFGDGVYDVALVANGKPFALEEHLDRFYRSCSMIEIDFDRSRAEMKAIFSDLIARLDENASAILYWQASRGTALRNHTYPEKGKPNLLAYITPKALPDITKTATMITVPDRRYQLCNVKTINLLANLMETEKAKRAGCDEAILVRDRYVMECSHSNLSILCNGVFRTAPLTEQVLPGIARKHLIELCLKLGIPVEEKAFTVEEMMHADEVLQSSTTTFCRRVTAIDGISVGGRDSAHVHLLQQAFSDKLQAETGVSLLS